MSCLTIFFSDPSTTLTYFWSVVLFLHILILSIASLHFHFASKASLKFCTFLISSLLNFLDLQIIDHLFLFFSGPILTRIVFVILLFSILPILELWKRREGNRGRIDFGALKKKRGRTEITYLVKKSLLTCQSLLNLL